MQSKWFTLAAAFSVQTDEVATAKSSKFIDNPPWPLDLGQGTANALFVMTRGDKLIDQPGQREERRLMRVVVGAVSIEQAHRAIADALHFAVRDAIKSMAFMQRLKDAGGAHVVREVEIEPELREPTSVGTVLMSAYEVEYFQTYPSFA